MSQLRQKMIRAMQLREFSPKTQKAYVAAVSGLAKYCNKSPHKIDQKEVENYLLYLRQETGKDITLCPCCGKGTMHSVCLIPKGSSPSGFEILHPSG